MAINTTDTKGALTTSFAGRVLEIVKAVETRNWSDTMDYTDFRTTECTYALVWLGTHAPPADNREGRPVIRYDHLTDTWNANKARELEFFEQFAYVDVTNLFGWRGEPRVEPAVDAAMGDGDPMMWANYIAWKSHVEAERKAAAQAAQKAAEAKAAKIAAAAAYKAKHRPEVGKPMKVVRGRKVKPGTEGTVAYISGDRVLLKGDAEWKDRKAQGVWVDASYLEARS